MPTTPFSRVDFLVRVEPHSLRSFRSDEFGTCAWFVIANFRLDEFGTYAWFVIANFRLDEFDSDGLFLGANARLGFGSRGRMRSERSE